MRIIKLKLKRFRHNKDTTLGMLFINEEYECFTLEDEPRLQKVYGKTRIPAGHYEIGLRTVGRLHEKYKKRFPTFHVGMLYLKCVPNFTHIMFHIGNDHFDTLGCPLVGKAPTVKGLKLVGSTLAYESMYKKITHYLVNEKAYVYVKIKDE